MRPANEAPLPPWWVVEAKYGDGDIDFEIWGGPRHRPIKIFAVSQWTFSNAKELAELIVQRCKP